MYFDQGIQALAVGGVAIDATSLGPVYPGQKFEAEVSYTTF